jgi:hypothetical protein
LQFLLPLLLHLTEQRAGILRDGRDCSTCYRYPHRNNPALRRANHFHPTGTTFRR